MRAAINVAVVLDVVCPWCRVGKANFDRARAWFRERHPDIPVEVRWHPYFLARGLPAAGVPYRDYMLEKFGSALALDALFARVSAAVPDGLAPFAFDAIELRPNTLAAHRLIDWVQCRGEVADTLVGRMFEAFFVEGRDLGDVETLADVAAEAGADRAATIRYLASGDRADEVLAAGDALAGIGGVPVFVIGGRSPVSGAAAPDVLLTELEAASAVQ